MARGAIQLVETFFKKYFWIASLAMIAVIALILAGGVNNLVAGMLARFTVVVPPASGGPVDPTEALQDPNAMGIVELFEVPETPEGAAEGSAAVEVPEVAPEPPAAEPTAEGDCVPTTLSAMLVGTVADDDGRWGHGIVQDQTANRTIIARPGTLIAGAEVTRIERNRIFVLNGGAEECLIAGRQPTTAGVSADATALDEASGVRRSNPAEALLAPPAVPVETSATSGGSDLTSSVRRVSATQYEIDRAGINAVLQNPQLLQRDQPEFQQSFADGQPSGIRLTRIPTGSVFTQLGIRQGDTIVDVNGRPVTTPQRAMDLYEELQSESHLEITVERRGRRRTLTYDIR